VAYDGYLLMTVTNDVAYDGYLLMTVTNDVAYDGYLRVFCRLSLHREKKLRNCEAQTKRNIEKYCISGVLCATRFFPL